MYMAISGAYQRHHLGSGAGGVAHGVARGGISGIAGIIIQRGSGSSVAAESCVAAGGI